MKKYYKKQYKLLCERFRNKNSLNLLKEREPLYYEAYKTIKEYY